MLTQPSTSPSLSVSGGEGDLPAAAYSLEDRVVLGGEFLGDRGRLKADHFFRGPAEHPLRGRVPQHHVPVGVERDDGVGGGFDDRARGCVYPLPAAAFRGLTGRGSPRSDPPSWVCLICHHPFMVPPRNHPGQRKTVTPLLDGAWLA
jgi:hypothetical protein